MLKYYTTSHAFKTLAMARGELAFEDENWGALSKVAEKDLNSSIFPVSIPWALNIWHNPVVKEFSAIREAKNILCEIQRNWSLFPGKEYRRALLIQDELPSLSTKPTIFPSPAKSSPLGTWTLLSKNKILYSSACSAKVPHGIYKFEENKSEPPSRAYLKLWEFFCRQGILPKSDTICLDLGASPGGWSWVLSSLCKKIYAIDRSPLDSSLKTKKNIYFKAGDALKIANISNIDPQISWIFCDAALHPEKLVPHFLNILEKHPNVSFVVTIKFAGTSRYHWLDTISQVSDTSICHLSQNKHECTWYRVAPGSFIAI